MPGDSAGQDPIVVWDLHCTTPFLHFLFMLHQVERLPCSFVKGFWTEVCERLHAYKHIIRNVGTGFLVNLVVIGQGVMVLS